MPVNEEQKISILIAEYNSLRSETVTRTGHGFQIAGFSITALSIWAAEETSGRTWLALTAIIFLLVASGWFTFREIAKANRRIREIELDVNDRAGEDLLIWENLWDGWRLAFGAGPARILVQNSNLRLPPPGAREACLSLAESRLR